MLVFVIGIKQKEECFRQFSVVSQWNSKIQVHIDAFSSCNGNDVMPRWQVNGRSIWRENAEALGTASTSRMGAPSRCANVPRVRDGTRHDLAGNCRGCRFLRKRARHRHRNAGNKDGGVERGSCATSPRQGRSNCECEKATRVERQTDLDKTSERKVHFVRRMQSLSICESNATSVRTYR
jgi:hypothetical protein